MLILTNCLTDKADEGCLKVAKALIKRIKVQDEKTFVLTYDREHSLSDKHIKLNKFMLSTQLIKNIKKRKTPVLYVPFPAKTLATALRIFILSLFCEKRLSVLMVQKYHYGFLAKLLLKLSCSRLIVLSKESKDFYSEIVNLSRVKYIKAGVDVNRFIPVDRETQIKLKKKYEFDDKLPVVLHVGHLNKGRGVDKLMDIDDKWQVVLVCSTLTRDEQDSKLKNELLSRGNIRIIDDYIPHIEEFYQLCDVYFFPTQEAGKCIDIPLSCMEAASCNTPVVTTDFGEMKEFIGKDGFYFIDRVDKASINQAIEKALREHLSPRNAVLPYDFNDAVDNIKALF